MPMITEQDMIDMISDEYNLQAICEAVENCTSCDPIALDEYEERMLIGLR